MKGEVEDAEVRCGYTACYQLRAKSTGLSRESTLSLSRITVCKESPKVRTPYTCATFARR
jgi:hypothetical protein